MRTRLLGSGLFAGLTVLSGCSGGLLSGDLPGGTDSGPVIGEKAGARERARVHTELAGAYYQRGNLGVALSEARIAVDADSGYAPAYSMLAVVYGDLKEPDLAEDAYQRALRINPNDPDVNHNYAWFLCENKREADSIRYFLIAIRHPLYATPQKSYVMAAVCSLRIKNERDAEEYLERALRLDPNYYPALINLAQIKYRRGELDAARGLVGGERRRNHGRVELVRFGLARRERLVEAARGGRAIAQSHAHHFGFARAERQ